MKKRKLSCLLFALIWVLTLAFSCISGNQNGIYGASPDNELLRVLFIDVGQGDSILILSPEGKTMLIDAGEDTASKEVISALLQYGVSKIDFLVATHPHSDHIGGMEAVIESFSVDNIYMPDVPYTSEAYDSLLDCIEQKNIPLFRAKSGVAVDFSEMLSCYFLGPAEENYEDINDYSAVLKLSYGATSFLFMGDAAFPAEEDILAEHGKNLSATVLKIGHHGSSTSTSENFLSAVSPSYAVISCGAGNSFNHPHTATLDLLASGNIITYRTDELGNILATSDGSSVIFDKEGEVPISAASTMDYVYITKTGGTYHRADCSYLSESKKRIALKDAIALGYMACQKCFPN